MVSLGRSETSTNHSLRHGHPHPGHSPLSTLDGRRRRNGAAAETQKAADERRKQNGAVASRDNSETTKL